MQMQHSKFLWMTQNSSKNIFKKIRMESILEKKCIDLTWHDNQVIFRKAKTIATTSRSLELAWTNF